MILEIKENTQKEDVCEISLVQHNGVISLESSKDGVRQTLCKLFADGDMRTYDNAHFKINWMS